MPHGTARIADIYQVASEATLGGMSKPQPRPMVCVAERPTDPLAWTAMARTVSAGDPGVDLASPADASLGLSEDGWWSTRFIHSVRKSRTDKIGCRYVSTLQDPLRKEVLDHYRNR